MESPRSTKRRKLETIPESPFKTGSAGETTPASQRKTSGARSNASPARGKKVDVYDGIEGAQTEAPRTVAKTPTKVYPAPTPTPKPAPPSASRAAGLNGLMKRINAKLAEKNGNPPQKSVTPGPHDAPPGANGGDGSDPAQKRNGSRDSFEKDQLERAARRKPKRTLEDQMRDIADASRREVETEGLSRGAGRAGKPLSKAEHKTGQTASASPSKARMPATEKRKPGRPRKHPLPAAPAPGHVRVDTPDGDDDNNNDDGDDGPVSPSKSASVRKQAQQRIHPRALSPMVLDLHDKRHPQISPRKPFASPVKPRQRTLIELDTKPLPTTASTGLSIASGHLRRIQSAVLDQLQGRSHCRFVGLEAEYDNISSLVDQTIAAGESNSMVVIGARGSGKSAVLESIIQEQLDKNRDAFHVVRLNGFVHTDDKIALRDIWRQLGREMELEEDAASKNYADTLTTLLALLSHPSELGQPSDQVTKSVIFILDEFDLFATHPRQTLLYNLFDIAQSRKAPIAVLGLTTRFDVAESLEKRVKSRFSHRHVHFSLAKNLSTFRDICQNNLTPPSTPDVSNEGHSAWTAMLTDLFTQEAFNTNLRRIYYISKSVPAFQTSMLLPLSTLHIPPDTDIQTSDLLTHFNDPATLTALAPPDTKLSCLASLSTLQLALLISAARLTIIHDTDTVTFALVYAEYVSLASKARIQASASGALAAGGGVGRVWTKDVAKGAWEGLIELELCIPDGPRGVRVDVALEEIEGVVEVGATMAKWCREI